MPPDCGHVCFCGQEPIGFERRAASLFQEVASSAAEQVVDVPGSLRGTVSLGLAACRCHREIGQSYPGCASDVNS